MRYARRSRTIIAIQGSGNLLATCRAAELRLRKPASAACR
jgi:hypothetical protein